MTERTDHTSEPPEEPTLVTPVMDGAAELRAEADAAVEAGEVDLPTRPTAAHRSARSLPTRSDLPVR